MTKKELVGRKFNTTNDTNLYTIEAVVNNTMSEQLYLRVSFCGVVIVVYFVVSKVGNILKCEIFFLKNFF